MTPEETQELQKCLEKVSAILTQEYTIRTAKRLW